MLECKHRDAMKKRMAFVEGEIFYVCMCDDCFYKYVSSYGFIGSRKPESIDNNYYRDNLNDNAVHIYEGE